ncbi:hypothetical protein NY2A_b526R [Paramecium bursaria Chlorella virus NY2A]|uniref:Uncharacterized protein b526R n=1 Tax=Paramecium bursaria Chlorella virus NY2A TaxID=46021 RepID=A7IX51_PBCVN|nr:hypothetical protein NY2A_b526R [Paramecium bursaria Chlorella virus NY2A]ABT14925.1 hypothetical protein NY2A_b526R [Paramecium bursaria Chlorella virus NY2A]
MALAIILRVPRVVVTSEQSRLPHESHEIRLGTSNLREIGMRHDVPNTSMNEQTTVERFFHQVINMVSRFQYIVAVDILSMSLLHVHRLPEIRFVSLASIGRQTHCEFVHRRNLEKFAIAICNSLIERRAAICRNREKFPFGATEELSILRKITWRNLLARIEIEGGDRVVGRHFVLI